MAIESSRGGKILLYQDLYQQYSRLAFTHQQDRPIAIAGLEKRLIQSLGVRGGFGVLDELSGLGLLRRSLLWRRGTDEANLERIVFRGGGGTRLDELTGRTMPAPPSWSWMAYRGAIEYLDLPFDGVEWEGNEIRSPWTPGDAEVWHSADEVGVVELSAVVRDFDQKAAVGPSATLIHDDPLRTDGLGLPLKCVVFGKLKSPGQDVHNMRHYVMVVSHDASQVARGEQVYMRVGVGCVPGKVIDLGQLGVTAKIR